MFNYPKQAIYNKVLPKSKIYEQAKPGKAVRECFVKQVDQIVWKYVLATRTINLPVRKPVQEIAIIEISLRTKDVKEDVLRVIDKAVPVPIFYILKYKDQIKSVAAYKRPSEADHDKWVVSAYFGTPWQSADIERPELPVALDMSKLYEQMLRRHISMPPRPKESLKDQVERMMQIRSKDIECRKLESLINKEKQFNRKVEINSQLRSLKRELENLSAKAL
ncbi:MAG TPA: DUF4391 domain-containing protein [Nitrospirae bacterium]|nr:DUF4391 domain-containing protein [Nitrospirota bacterium]